MRLVEDFSGLKITFLYEIVNENAFFVSNCFITITSKGHLHICTCNMYTYYVYAFFKNSKVLEQKFSRFLELNRFSISI